MAEEKKTGQISDKKAAQKIISLLPDEIEDKVPAIIRDQVMTKVVEKLREEQPAIYKLLLTAGDLPDEQKDKVSDAIMKIVKDKLPG